MYIYIYTLILYTLIYIYIIICILYIYTNIIYINVYIYIYTGSRKMVLMNLLAGKEWRGRYREWTCGQCGRERVGQMEKVASTHIHYHE